ncbi:hypothetical protein [Streptomyces lonarensis]|uniref:Uncharacterized protein n=1 Tax=Streptomyces lonarensis TaxID=700599 RepID=A0A7X6HXE3_9ACTN|nr:hypothetical protein [Streptomyces lonarensis]NJQ04260.1 hypothetical protein [Streptomyces lonarensis]
MAAQNSTLHLLDALSDGDAATASPRAAARRELTVAEANATYRAELVTEFVTATDWADELRLLADATRYDQANPDEDSLFDELNATRIGDLAVAA